MQRLNGRTTAISLLLLLTCPEFALAKEHELHSFERVQLTDVYFSEGASSGDINGDGLSDVVCGPYWFAGPKFQQRFEIYKAVPQPLDKYADNFFSWVYDFNGDGHNDVFVVGFPGTPAYVYENPGQALGSRLWKKHQVFDWVSNESPQFLNLVDDERPELVCTRDGFFGFATIDWKKPLEPWTLHVISEKAADARFGHGLGVGDVNGDGRNDVLHAGGWYEQPIGDVLNGRWKRHDVKFTDSYGGADMHAYDVDGDGDNDIITSLAAHDFGLAWYENTTLNGEITFQPHLIMGDHPSRNRYGVVFSELHAVALVDVDGDGLEDIVTGKTFGSHHQQSPMWDAGAVVYWFKLVRGPEGVDYIPYLIDDQSGIGRQLTIADVNNDQQPDIIIGGMKGSHVLLHQTKLVDESTWIAAQPLRYTGPKLVVPLSAKSTRGPRSPIDSVSGLVDGAAEAESLTFVASAGTALPQNMSGFNADRWSNNEQVWWTGARPGEKLSMSLPKKSNCQRIELVLTCARDYGIVQLQLDDKKLGEPIDLYDTEVTTTGVLSFPVLAWQGESHTLSFELLGANENADKSYMVGIDYVRLIGTGDKFAPPRDGVIPVDATGRALNFDFETGTLVDWTADGDAFNNQPIQGDTVSARRKDMRSDHKGEYWIGGFEKLGDGATGTLTSVPFKVSQPFATFLLGGGSSTATRFELIRQGQAKPFYQISGVETEAMHQVVVDLSSVSGEEIYIRLVDESKVAWGHLNFDHFRLQEKKPSQVTAMKLQADDYPHRGLDAADAVAAMKLPEGFTASIFASEPDVKQPIAFCLDDRGRVWVAEAYEYPIRAKEGTGRDRILIFEDVDGDGKFDKRIVFAEGLNLVSGLEVGYGGIWVGAAPHLLFIPDENGDDQPDSEPRILLDGWGFQDTHETLNTFIWGPDGWLYGCHGVFTHSLVGKPGLRNEDRIPINAGVWRYHPVRHEFEVFAHGTSNPWGVDFNDHGQAICTACVIPHLFHIIQNGRYQRQAGQHFNTNTYQDIVTIADHLHYRGSNPHGGNGRSDEAGGGHAHAGAMIYLADTWPAKYRGAIFMNNIHGQRLNVDLLKPSGSGYVGTHAPDFLLTGDQASQILNLRTGPDGQAFLIDWYDMQACHLTEIEKHDRSNGRIYKISYGENKYTPVDLGKQSDLQLAELMLHSNDYFVRHARKILAHRATSRAIDDVARQRLLEIAINHADETRQLRGMWALHTSGGVPSSVLDRAMTTDTSPYVRGWAIQLAVESMESEPSSTKLISRLETMACQELSPIVRLYLASAVQRLDPSSRWGIVEGLAGHAEDANDHNLPLMIWYGAEPLADVDPQRALALALSVGKNIPLLRDFMMRRIGSRDLDSSLALLVDGLGKAEDEKLQLVFLEAIKSAVSDKRQVAAPSSWAATYGRLEQSDLPAVKTAAVSLGVTFGDSGALHTVRAIVKSDTATVDARKSAIATLLQANDAELPLVLQSLLNIDELRLDAVRGLAQYDHPLTASKILAALQKMDAAEKAAAMATLCTRANYATEMLHAIRDKQLSSADLSADLVRQLTYFENAEIDRLLGELWGQVRQTAADKAELIASYTKMLSTKPAIPVDRSLGRAVFAKTCQRCHVLYAVGQKLGPDLTGSNRSNLEYLLTNIVDPSAVMANEYRQSLVLTENGRVITGIVRAENDQSVTIQTADATIVVPESEIVQRKASDKSMMPDDQLKPFSEHEIRSLIAYLSASEQVPVLATKENTTQFFNRKDLSGWSRADGLWTVENEELVGRTEGLKNNQWLVSDLQISDFRLSLDVKLVDNAGNSGIQFRSVAEANGEVAGYQADIGAGWWGKLYEEHGRGLLSAKSGEQAIHAGQWNRYEVEAIGNRVRTRINGVECVDLEDPAGAKRGIIALQLHSGGPTEVRFKNLELEVVSP